MNTSLSDKLRDLYRRWDADEEGTVKFGKRIAALHDDAVAIEKDNAKLKDDLTRLKVLHDAAIRWGNEMEARAMKAEERVKILEGRLDADSVMMTELEDRISALTGLPARRSMLQAK